MGDGGLVPKPCTVAEVQACSQHGEALEGSQRPTTGKQHVGAQVWEHGLRVRARASQGAGRQEKQGSPCCWWLQWGDA